MEVNVGRALLLIVTMSGCWRVARLDVDLAFELLGGVWSDSCGNWTSIKDAALVPRLLIGRGDGVFAPLQVQLADLRREAFLAILQFGVLLERQLAREGPPEGLRQEDIGSLLVLDFDAFRDFCNL